MKRVFFTLGLIAILTMNCLGRAQITTNSGRPPEAYSQNQTTPGTITPGTTNQGCSFNGMGCANPGESCNYGAGTCYTDLIGGYLPVCQCSGDPPPCKTKAGGTACLDENHDCLTGNGEYHGHCYTDTGPNGTVSCWCKFQLSSSESEVSP